MADPSRKKYAKIWIQATFFFHYIAFPILWSFFLASMSKKLHRFHMDIPIAVIGALIVTSSFTLVFILFHRLVLPVGELAPVVSGITSFLLHGGSHRVAYYGVWPSAAYSAFTISTMLHAKVIDHEDRLHLIKSTGLCIGQSIVALLVEMIGTPSEHIRNVMAPQLVMYIVAGLFSIGLFMVDRKTLLPTRAAWKMVKSAIFFGFFDTAGDDDDAIFGAP